MKISRTRSISTILVAALLAAALGGAGCGKKEAAPAPDQRADQVVAPAPQPPSIQLPVVEAVPVVMPVTEAPTNPDLIAYVRLRSPDKLIDEVAPWAKPFQPDLDAAFMRAQLQGLGLDLGDLREDANVAGFVWVIPTPQPVPHWALLVPTAPDSAFALSMKKMQADAVAGTVGDDLLLAGDAEAMTAAGQAGEQLATLGNAPLQEDYQIFLNVSSLMEKYGLIIRSGVNMMTGMMAANTPPGQTAEQTLQIQRLIKAEAALLLDALDQLEQMTITLDLEPDYLEIATTIAAKEGTEIAAVLSGGPRRSPDLGAYLTPGYVMGMQLSLKDMAALVDMYRKFFKLLVPAEQPDAFNELDKMLSDWQDIADFDYAFAGYLGDEKGMAFEGVMRSDDAARTMTLMRESMAWMKSEAMAAMSMGMTYEVEAKADARKLDGLSVDSYKLTPLFSDAMPAQQRELIGMIYGGALEMEAMRVGELVLVATAGRLDTLYARMKDGQTGVGLAAMDEFPPGAMYYADLDMGGYLKWIGRMAAAVSGTNPMPEIVGPPVTMAGYAQDGKGWGRMRIPRELMAAPAASYSRARETAMRNSCINNLRQIDGAKEQWALEGNKREGETPTAAEISPYLKGGFESMKCPEGGTYRIGPLGQDLPTCTVPGHEF